VVPLVLNVTRALLALEFAAALGTWVLGACPWWVSWVVSTATLTVFLLTWTDERAVCVDPCAPASSRRCR
jgi:hypothetical protein